jgi:hypothetical protein
LIYALEFGGRNSNLHCHSLYCGPRLPKPRVRGKQGELSRWWQDACRGTVFEGSRIISVKQAGNFHAALAHSLKYPSKYLECSTPARLASLEAAFHATRRVSTLGAFYNAVSKHSEDGNGLECPMCHAALHKDGAWWPVPVLRRGGGVGVGGGALCCGARKTRLGSWGAVSRISRVRLRGGVIEITLGS